VISAVYVLAATTSPSPIDPGDTSGDVGTAGPTGLAVIVLLLIAAALLVKSMSRHLKKVPRSFDPEDQLPQVPDTPEELLRRPPQPAQNEPGHDLLDELRRAPRAIEPPRRTDDRPDQPPAEG
jgi:hypothetical protein